MPKVVAFLRAINVGGHTVKMEELRSLFEAMGFQNVETFIASGNVIFDTKAKNMVALQKKIELDLEGALGYEVVTFVRSLEEVLAIAKYLPFKPAEIETAQAFSVAFLKEPLTSDGEKALKALQTEQDRFHVHASEVYWLCRVKQNESVFSNVVLERKLKLRATFRGMSTMVKLAAKYDAAKPQ